MRVSSSVHWLWLSFKDQSLEKVFHMEHLEELSRSRRQSRVVYWVVAQNALQNVVFAFALLIPELHNFAIGLLSVNILSQLAFVGIILYDRCFETLASSRKVSGERLLQLTCSLICLGFMVVTTLTCHDMFRQFIPVFTSDCSTLLLLNVTERLRPLDEAWIPWSIAAEEPFVPMISFAASLYGTRCLLAGATYARL